MPTAGPPERYHYALTNIERTTAEQMYERFLAQGQQGPQDAPMQTGITQTIGAMVKTDPRAFGAGFSRVPFIYLYDELAAEVQTDIVLLSRRPEIDDAFVNLLIGNEMIVLDMVRGEDDMILTLSGPDADELAQVQQGLLYDPAKPIHRAFHPERAWS